MKKFLSLFLCAIMLLGAFSALAACGNTEGGTEPEKPGGEEVIPPEEKPKEKPQLLFLIDEGISGNGLTSYYKDDFPTMDKYFENIMAAVDPLKEKYDVSFLIYLNWHYSEKGYGGKDASQPLNRISPELKHTLEYFSATEYSIYLEAYSSGGYTNQNGELGRLPLVPLHYGETETHKSLMIDMEALSAIMETYSVVRGLRFHELIGSNMQAENGHGFRVSKDVIYAFADICDKYDKTLVWGDHSWKVIFNDPNQEWWQEVLENVSSKLGENLIVNFNNNSRYVMNSIQFKDILDDGKHGRRWGLSNQAWYWAEAEVVMGNDWYEDSDIDMPAELTAIFTLEAIERGASLIQYEPVGYFFNCAFGDHNDQAQIGYFEEKEDFTATLKFEKFKEMMLADKKDLPSTTVQDYYTDSERKLFDNLEMQKAKVFAQATMGVFGDTTEYFNKYSSDPSQTYTYKTPYFRERVTEGAQKILRLHLSYNAFDQYLVKKTVNGNAIAQIYWDTNALIYENASMFADNKNGTFLDAVAINLQQKVVFDGCDSDEIVVLRKNGSVITPTVYSIQNAQNQNTRMRFTYQENAELSAKLGELMNTEINGDNFVQLLGVRQRNVRLQNDTRPLDAVVCVTEENGKLVFNGTVGELKLERTETAKPAGFVGLTVGDINIDHADEIGIIYGDTVKFYGLQGQSLFNAKVEIKTGIENIQYASIFRKTTAYIGLE